MHIVVMIRILPSHSLGGMQKQCMDLCSGFVSKGHEVTILTTSRRGGAAKEEFGGINIHFLPSSRPGKYSESWNRACRDAIIKLHQEKPVDVIHSQSLGAIGVLKWARKNQIPVVSTWHGTSLTEIGTFLSSSSKRPRSWPWLVIMPLKFFKQYIWMDVPMRRASSAITLVSPTLKKDMRFFCKNKPEVIVNGIEIPESIPNRSERKNIRLLCLGRIEKEKGMHLAISALKNIDDDSIMLDIVGTGPYLNKIKLDAESDERIKVHGRLNDNELTKIFEASDIYVTPTTRNEGLPLTILESMASGLPVIASNIGGIPSVVEDGIDGLLLTPGNVAELASAIRKLSKDSELRAKMSENARKKIEEKYSKEMMVVKTLRVFERVVEGC